jgi:anti-anti-sigma regulatory factor
MNEQLSLDENKSHLRISGDLTIYEVERLKDDLSTLTTETVPSTIDCSELCNIDTAGLQMLVALDTHLRSMGNECRFTNPSDTLAKGMSLYQMDSPAFEAEQNE